MTHIGDPPAFLSLIRKLLSNMYKVVNRKTGQTRSERATYRTR